MRLGQAEQEKLIAVVDGFLAGQRAELLLFGSRLNDALGGGDIDLLLRVDPEFCQTLQKEKIKILNQLKKKLGDRHIDLKIVTADQMDQDAFLSAVRATAVTLAKWP